MKKIEETKLWQILLKLEKFIIVLTSWLCVLTIGITVILRYIFHADLYGNEEFLVIFAIWLYFMGAAHGSYQKSQIEADIIKSYVKNKNILKFFDLFTCFISTFTTAILSFWGFKYFIWGMQKGAKSIGWRIPMVIPQSAIFIGFILMFAYSLFYLMKSIQIFKISKN